MNASTAAYCMGVLTAEKDSLARIFNISIIGLRLDGNAKKPNLQPPAPHHLLKPLLIIVLSG